MLVSCVELATEELSNFVKRRGIAELARSVNENGPFLSEEEFSKVLAEDCKRTGRDFSKALEGGRFGDTENAEIAKAWRALRDAGLSGAPAVLGDAAEAFAKQRDALRKLGGSRTSEPRDGGSSAPFHAGDTPNPTMSPGRASLKPRSSGVSGKPAQQGVNNPRLSIEQLQALIDAQRAEADDNENDGEAYEKLCKLAADMQAERPELTFAQHFAKIYTSREHRGLAEAERRENRPSASW